MEYQKSLSKTTINLKGQIIDLEIPKVMGILNITPDSFYDGGKYESIDKVRCQIEKYIAQGTDILDIGAFSSRPGAAYVDVNEEKIRLQPVLELILKLFPDLIVSIDTFRAEIATWAVEDYGVAMINDISSGELDKEMFDTIAKLQVPYIMMHMQGNPANMQIKPSYNNVVEEIIKHFAQKLEKLKQLCIHDVIIDPGFGFGKTIEHNYQILNSLQDFKIFNLPILVGLSRKSMIYRFLENSPDESLNGTTVLNTIALLKGAKILRVHDVLEAKETIRLVNQCLGSN